MVIEHQRVAFAAAGGVLAGYADQLGDTVVIDATNRFIHPASLALEADVPQASVDTRLATLIRVILRVLGSGIV